MILYQLPIKEIVAMSETNGYFHALCNTQSLWKFLLSRDYSIKREFSNYKEEYIPSHLDLFTIKSLRHNLSQTNIDGCQSKHRAGYIDMIEINLSELAVSLLLFHRKGILNLHSMLQNHIITSRVGYRATIGTLIARLDTRITHIYRDNIVKCINEGKPERVKSMMDAICGNIIWMNVIRISLSNPYKSGCFIWVVDYCIEIIESEEYDLHLKYSVAKIIISASLCFKEVCTAKGILSYAEKYLTPEEISQISRD
jgi:hypothetical protein